MSGAGCTDISVERGKPDDFPTVFNPWGSQFFDWSKAFPSTGETIGTVLLYVACASFAALIVATDASCDEVLGYMTLFTGVQWIPYIAYLLLVNGNPVKGLFLNLVYRPDFPPVGLEDAWVRRTVKAQQTNTESLTVFAPAVLLFIFRHATDKDDIKYICWAYAICRSIHYAFCVGPIGSPYAIPVVPTVTFLGSIFCSLTIVIMALA